MNQDLERLIALSKADAETARLHAEIAELPKRVSAIETKLARTKAQVEAAKKAIADDAAEKRKQESAITDQQGKISKYRDQQLAVKTNDQYRALTHEIQFAEEAIRKSEDKILELMLDSEEREKALKAAELELKAEMAEVEKEKAAARERTAIDEAELKQWKAKREELRAGIDDTYLQHYDRVLKQRHNPIAGVRDQICQACHVMMRPQTYNELSTGEKLITCSSCGRILYYDPAAVETAEAQPHDPAKPAGVTVGG
jgi:predicted  nucleic acid-binding Zn-ribbon protein